MTVEMSDKVVLHTVTLMPASWAMDEAQCCSLQATLARLTKSRIRTTLLCAEPMYHRKLRKGHLVAPPKPIRYFSLPGRGWRPISGAFLFARVVGQLWEMHRMHRIDLLHAHGFLPCGHAAMLLNRELSIPYIVSVYGHDDLSELQFAGPIEKWRHRIAHRVCAESCRVVCGSEQIREQVLERTGRACRTSVVYHGVDPELFSPSPEHPDHVTILTGGKLQARGRHDLLIRATAVLAKDLPSISLEIVGDGPERSRLQTLAKQQSLAEVVHFLGHQSERELAAVMKRCTLFALPGQSEGISCMHLEAMSSGKAAIGCRGQGIAEIIDHGTNGFLVGAGNDKELELAMRMLLHEPDRRRDLGAAARDTILDRLTVEHRSQNLARIYREVVG
jgi:teichuronic acid biosynthesis glycosyltransferase TuaC